MAGPSTALVHCWSGLAGPAAKSLPWSVGLLRLPWDAILKRQVWRVVQSSCEESKLCLLLPGSEICKSLIIRIPAPKKSGYCPAVLVAPWQHHWSRYVNKLPSVHSLHSIFTMCHVLDLLHCQGSVEQKQIYTQDSFWNAVWTQCAFPSHAIWGWVGDDISCPLRNINCWEYSTSLCMYALWERPIIS